MRDFVQIDAPMALATDVEADVRESEGNREILDSTARTIASYWASPNANDMPLTMLSQGQRVDAGDVLESISHNYRLNGVRGTVHALELDMLATWVINGGREEF